MELQRRFLLWSIFASIIAFVISILNHFIYAWSNNSKGIAWFASNSESVLQHLKQVLWPWLLVILPLDLVWAGKDVRHSVLDKEEKSQDMVTALTANVASLLSFFVFIYIFFAIFYYANDKKDNLAFSITLFVLAFVLAIMLRYILARRDRVATLVLSSIVLLSTAYFFVQFSYNADEIGTSYLFDPHDNE